MKEMALHSFALDVDNRILRGYYNTRLIFTDTSIPNATTTDYAPFGRKLMEVGRVVVNFGQRPFVTPPDGYETISIANIEHILFLIQRNILIL